MLPVFLFMSLLLLLPPCVTLNVLLVPFPAYSHVKSLLAIGKKLVEKGKQAYMLTDAVSDKQFGPETRHGVEFIVYGRNSKKLEKMKNNLKDFFTKPLEGEVYTFGELKEKFNAFTYLLEQDILIENEAMMAELMRKKINICVVDVSIVVKLTILIPHRLGVPYIVYCDILEPWLVRTPWLPSIHSHDVVIYDKNYKLADYSFWNRLYNTVTYAFFKSFTVFRDCSPETLEAYRKFGHFKDLDDLISKAQLFFIPDDAIMQPNLPQTSNVVAVGGLTTELISSSPLPSSFLSFIHRSNNTVIVSFGSQFGKYPTQLYATFIDAFRQLPQFQFVWKVKQDPLVETPVNVMTSEWIPQNDLLSQPSTKAFITHSGNNGLFEAIVHGVPLVACPIQSDQFRNTERVISRAFGMRLDVVASSSHQLSGAILEVTGNGRYKQNIQKASEIFKSAPQSPSERAAYWIEHIARFGNDHLRPAGNEMSWWQYLLLDVLLFLFVCALLLCVGVFVCLKYLLSFAFNKRQTFSKKQQ